MVTALKRRLFNLLMERLVQAEVEEFRLDKGASFNPAEAEGKANLAKRFVLSSLYLTAAYVRTAVLLEMTSASQSLHPVRILTLGQIATLLNNILVRMWVRCHAQKMNRFAGEKVKDPFAGMLATTLTARPALRPARQRNRRGGAEGAGHADERREHPEPPHAAAAGHRACESVC